MPNETENFDRLLQLLALKRHEPPPPGYFDRLPRDIRLELQAGAALRPARERRRRDHADWLQHLLQALEARPYLAGVFGVGACALILGGLIDSKYLDQPATPVTIGSLAPMTPGLSTMGAEEGLALDSFGTNSSTSPVIGRPSEAWFNGGWIKPQPANFNFPPAQ
jgi:hypothetical protein